MTARKSKSKNDGNGKDEEQIRGSFTAFRMTTKNKGREDVAADCHFHDISFGLLLSLRRSELGSAVVLIGNWLRRTPHEIDARWIHRDCNALWLRVYRFAGD
jgi:hypothetical protein